MYVCLCVCVCDNHLLKVVNRLEVTLNIHYGRKLMNFKNYMWFVRFVKVYLQDWVFLGQGTMTSL